jgi:ribonuclease P protein component
MAEPLEPDAPPPEPSAARYRFRRSQRLSGRRAFEAVYQANVRKTSGPLVVLARPNTLGHDRLGLSVSRRVGGAVQRNRIKRLLREAFRLMQHDWRDGYDLVIVVRPHEGHTLAEYQRLLFNAVRSLRKRCSGQSPPLAPG